MFVEVVLGVSSHADAVHLSTSSIIYVDLVGDVCTNLEIRNKDNGCSPYPLANDYSVCRDCRHSNHLSSTSIILVSSLFFMFRC